jgi:hypothetical protein
MERTNLAWLAGIIDAEGSIGLYTYPKKSNNKVTCYSNVIEISNTDVVIINESKRIIEGLLGFSINLYNGKTKGKIAHKTYKLRVTRRNDVAVVLSAIEKYLVGKKEQAQLLVKLIISNSNNRSLCNNGMLVAKMIKDLKGKDTKLIKDELTEKNDIEVNFYQMALIK